MNIKVIGKGCDKCEALYDNVIEATNNLGIKADIEKVEELLDIVKLGVKTVPSVMVDGELEISGEVANVEQIEEVLNKHK